MTDLPGTDSTLASVRAPAPPPAMPAPVQPADLVAAAVRAVPGVADLHSGAFGEVATYLPGRKVEGIRILDGHTEVHVVLTYGTPIRVTADAIRSAVAPLLSTRVDVTVEDVLTAEDIAQAAPTPSS